MLSLTVPQRFLPAHQFKTDSTGKSTPEGKAQPLKNSAGKGRVLNSLAAHGTLGGCPEQGGPMPEPKPALQGDAATAWQLQGAEPTGQKANSGRGNRKHDVLVLGKVGKVGLCWFEARLFSL